MKWHKLKNSDFFLFYNELTLYKRMNVYEQVGTRPYICSYFIPADQMSTYRIGTVWTIKEEEEEELFHHAQSTKTRKVGVVVENLWKNNNAAKYNRDYVS